MNGVDLAAIAAVVALVWFALRWAGRLDDYEDHIDEHYREMAYRHELERERFGTPTSIREHIDHARPYDWNAADPIGEDTAPQE
jgi:hypothetical protein